jgi:hypothetical protein
MLRTTKVGFDQWQSVELITGQSLGGESIRVTNAFEFSIEGRAFDAEDLGGAGFVTAGKFECFDDVIVFEVSE